MITARVIIHGLTVAGIVRRGQSASGNPSFTVTFTNGLVAHTESDAGVAHGIENFEYRDVPLDVTFTPDGTIKSWVVV